MNVLNRRLALALVTGALAGCAISPSKVDPFEQWNRAMYSVHETVDGALIKPIAQAYVRDAPEIFRTGLSNFFGNIDDFFAGITDALQGTDNRARRHGHAYSHLRGPHPIHRRGMASEYALGIRLSRLAGAGAPGRGCSRQRGHRPIPLSAQRVSESAALRALGWQAAPGAGGRIARRRRALADGPRNRPAHVERKNRRAFALSMRTQALNTMRNTMLRTLRPLLWTLVLLPIALSAQPALAQEAPDVLVKRVSEDVLATIRSDKDLQAGNQTKVKELIETKLAPNFDFTRMTALAVGRNWRAASPEQQKQLTDQFRTLLVRTYSGALTGYRNNTMDYKPLRTNPGDTDVIVRTEVRRAGQAPVQIDYNMGKAPEGWKAYDVVVAGVSLVTNYRDEFSDIVKNSGIDGLIKTLDAKNNGSAPPPSK